MKKLVSVFVLTALTTTVASAAPSYITRAGNGAYNVTYDYTDKAKTGWYVGGRLELSLLNWENEYSSDAVALAGTKYTEDFSFESLFGGSVYAGRTFNYFWRAELEAGLIGQFEDKDQGYGFKMTVPYLLANGYYDFANGFYVGAGLGIAVPKTELDDAMFVSGDRSKSSVSPMGALMVGWTYELDYNLVLDLRYRFAGFMGTEQTRVFGDSVSTGKYDLSNSSFTNDIGFIMDNSISLGVRYEF